ncbi:hypothetical protein ABZ569_32640 [Streptomyces albus]|uniref:hypothetical protein n=1 Tax=Streptomyces albus TaxID=1888 RepID=UPI00340F1979
MTDRDDFWTDDRLAALDWAARCAEALEGVVDAAVFLGLADRPLCTSWLGRFLFGRRTPGSDDA